MFNRCFNMFKLLPVITISNMMQPTTSSDGSVAPFTPYCTVNERSTSWAKMTFSLEIAPHLRKNKLKAKKK